MAIFLSIVIIQPSYTDSTVFIKGVALADWSHKEDLQTLNAPAYYGWGEYCPADDANCLNMVREMQLPQACPATLLVGNEPNAIEPNGAPISPANAVAKVKAIQAQCPQTKLVAGNVSADDWSVVGGYGSGYAWLKAFLKAYPTYNGAIGVHCYTQHSAQWCISQLAAMRKLYKGEMWVSEFGVLSQDGMQMRRLLDYIKRNFSGAFVYTNRQSTEAYRDGWALQGADLITANGLTPAGKVYAEWTP